MTIFKQGNLLCQNDFICMKHKHFIICLGNLYSYKNHERCLIFDLTDSLITILPVYDSTEYAYDLVSKLT